jgi:hypothetical protein
LTELRSEKQRELAAAQLRAAASRLLARVEHWSQPRWAQPTRVAEPAEGTRADVVHGLVQRLADLAAGVEGRSPQEVPRLDNDLVLPDQVRVMVADLLLAGAHEEALLAAASDVDGTAALLQR